MLERMGHGVDGRKVVEAAVVVGIDRDGAVDLGIPLLPVVVGEMLAVDVDDLEQIDAVLLGEGEIALVVRGHAHHRAVAVVDQHVVADPERDRLVAERVLDVEAGEQALLLLRRKLGFSRAAGLAFFEEGGHLGPRRRRVQRQCMLGRNGAERHAHDGVGPGREDVEAAVADQLAVGAVDPVREGEAHAFALADPVLLHRLDALGPARQSGANAIEQLFGVARDLQVVAGNLALLDDGARAPAAAFHDLLVGEHRLVDRIPVHGLRPALGDAGVEHLQEQPLVPLVVARIAGRDLAAPVDGQAHRLHLRLHGGDVLARPFRRRHAVLHRRVLGRQAEGVPAHRHQHIHAGHPQVAGQHVVDGVVAHMTHVQAPAGVRQHRAGVELRLGGVFADAIDIRGRPGRPGTLLDRARIEFGCHEMETQRAGIDRL